MPKKETKQTKTVVQSSGHSVKKPSFNRRKEIAHVAKVHRERTEKLKEKKVDNTFTCALCNAKFCFEGCYVIHRKSCGVECNTMCQFEQRPLSYENLAEIQGTKYSKTNKVKWEPTFKLHERLYVVTNLDPLEKQYKWIAITKYDNFEKLLARDGVSLIDKDSENVQFVDIQTNVEGEEQEIEE